MTTQEAGIPDAVVYAAAKAMLQLRHSGQSGVGYMALARAALEAADPAAARDQSMLEDWRNRAKRAESIEVQVRNLALEWKATGPPAYGDTALRELLNVLGEPAEDDDER